MEQTIDLNEVIQLLGLPLWLILGGWVICLIASIWLLVVAFKESVLWGLGSLLVPFVSLVFVVMHWAEAKRPFLVSLGGLGMLFGGFLMISTKMNTENPEMMGFLEKLRAERFGDFEPGEVLLPEPTPVPQISREEIAEKLEALKEQEKALLKRKAALGPNDHESARQVAVEIRAYNEQLELVRAMAEPFRKPAAPPADAAETEAPVAE